jgi:5'-3' exonuclease
MGERYSCIIVDLQNLYARNYAVHEKELYESIDEIISVGGIHGTIISIKKILRDYAMPDTKVYFLADNPTSRQTSRKFISPDYKINRIVKPRIYYRGLELTSLILQSYSDNFIYIQVPKMEADDVVPVIIDKLPKEEKILIVSNDMDWARCIDYHDHSVTWYNGKMIMTNGAFFDKYGFEPTEENIVNYKTYRGDASDNIEVGLPYIPEKIVLQLLDYGSVEDVILDVDNIEFLNPKWKALIKERAPRLKINQQLVSFYPLEYSEIKQFIIKGKFKPSTLRVLYEGLGFNVDQFDSRVSHHLNKISHEKGASKNAVSSYFSEPTIKRV